MSSTVDFNQNPAHMAEVVSTAAKRKGDDTADKPVKAAKIPKLLYGDAEVVHSSTRKQFVKFPCNVHTGEHHVVISDNYENHMFQTRTHGAVHVCAPAAALAIAAERSERDNMVLSSNVISALTKAKSYAVRKDESDRKQALIAYIDEQIVIATKLTIADNVAELTLEEITALAEQAYASQLAFERRFHSGLTVNQLYLGEKPEKTGTEPHKQQSASELLGRRIRAGNMFLGSTAELSSRILREEDPLLKVQITTLVSEMVANLGGILAELTNATVYEVKPLTPMPKKAGAKPTDETIVVSSDENDEPSETKKVKTTKARRVRSKKLATFAESLVKPLNGHELLEPAPALPEGADAIFMEPHVPVASTSSENMFADHNTMDFAVDESHLIEIPEGTPAKGKPPGAPKGRKTVSATGLPRTRSSDKTKKLAFE